MITILITIFPHLMHSGLQCKLNLCLPDVQYYTPVHKTTDIHNKLGARYKIMSGPRPVITSIGDRLPSAGSGRWLTVYCWISGKTSGHSYNIYVSNSLRTNRRVKMRSYYPTTSTDPFAQAHCARVNYVVPDSHPPGL